MPSSFAKHKWIHRCLGCLAACAIATSYVLLSRKMCQMPMLSHDDASNWIGRKNETKEFALTYYDWIQRYHCVTFGASILILILSIINIVPSHEDLKVLVITLGILIMGGAALFAFYTAFEAFHKTCKSLTNNDEYRIGTRLVKDKRPINAYEDEDDLMLQITAIDAGVGFVFLCCTFLFCFDSRQEMIEWRN